MISSGTQHLNFCLSGLKIDFSWDEIEILDMAAQTDLYMKNKASQVNKIIQEFDYFMFLQFY